MPLVLVYASILGPIPKPNKVIGFGPGFNSELIKRGESIIEHIICLCIFNIDILYISIFIDNTYMHVCMLYVL